jgi:hypothetical protein
MATPADLPPELFREVLRGALQDQTSILFRLIDPKRPMPKDQMLPRLAQEHGLDVHQPATVTMRIGHLWIVQEPPMDAPLCKVCGHRHYGTNHLTDAAAAKSAKKAKAAQPPPQRSRVQPSRLVSPPPKKKRAGRSR